MGARPGFIGFNLGREPWLAGWQKGAVEGERPVGDLWRGARAGAVSQPKPERTGPGQPRRVWPLPDRGGEDRGDRELGDP